MDNGQTFLVLGAMVLLAFLILNVNRTILGTTDNSLQAQAITSSNSAGQQIMDLIKSKSFDESTVNAVVTDINNFTAPNLLGHESGETINTFDDVDDFNQYSCTVSTPRMGNVAIKATVGYVNPGSPDILVASKTRMKKIEVKAMARFLPDTLRIYYYASY